MTTSPVLASFRAPPPLPAGARTYAQLSRWYRLCNFLAIHLGLTQAYRAVPRNPQCRDAVALTFDDAPHENALKMIDVFREYGGHGTFFCNGARIARLPDTARALAEAGHEIGNHGYSHRCVRTLSPDEIRAEFSETQRLIESVCNQKARYSRVPYVKYARAFWRVLPELNLVELFHACESEDWRAGISADAVFANVQKARPGDIVLMHAHPEATVSALPRILAHFKAQNIRVVTCSELFAR